MAVVTSLAGFQCTTSSLDAPSFIILLLNSARYASVVQLTSNDSSFNGDNYRNFKLLGVLVIRNNFGSKYFEGMIN